MLEASMSIADNLNDSVDLFENCDPLSEVPPETQLSITEEIDKTVSLPVTSNGVTDPDPDSEPNTLLDSVNMDEAIQYMVSNSVNPFETMAEVDVDVLMQEFPID